MTSTQESLTQHACSDKLQQPWPSLVVFCKRPQLGQGKQRLTQALSAEQTLVIAKALLACALEDCATWPGEVVIACASEQDMAWAQALQPKALVIAQLPSDQEGNLGQRLNHVDQSLRALGHQQLIFIGTDAPMLSEAHYQAATKAIAQHDVVLSHADDGGVVLMANAKPWPTITDLPWSSDKLSQALAKCCQQNQLGVHYIEPSYDIDYLADIKKLMIDLQTEQRPARQQLLTILKQLLISSGANHYA